MRGCEEPSTRWSCKNTGEVERAAVDIMPVQAFSRACCRRQMVDVKYVDVNVKFKMGLNEERQQMNSPLLTSALTTSKFGRCVACVKPRFPGETRADRRLPTPQKLPPTVLGS